MAAKKTKNTVEKAVDPDMVAMALAKAIWEGDIVNFQMLFSPHSPARLSSPEALEFEKYLYTQPDDSVRNDKDFVEALAAVRSESTWRHIQGELDAERPAQLPSELMLRLADSAVRLEKYANAAHAYELLRIRRRMQEEFLLRGDQAIDDGDIQVAVKAYVIALGLDYDYGAFPEPLPATPDYHSRALILHGSYPQSSEDCVSTFEPELLVQASLNYLLNVELAARLQAKDLSLRMDFLCELIHKLDPHWDTFAEGYREACKTSKAFGERLNRANIQGSSQAKSLQEEIETELGADPVEISAKLLGRRIDNAEWWQYLKELAYEHPAAALFISRQMVGDTEILVPRQRPNAELGCKLGIGIETQV